MTKRGMLAAMVISVLGLAFTVAADAPAGKTYKLNDDGFIQNWLVLEPVSLKEISEHTEEAEKPIFAKEYFKGQETVMPKAEEKVKVGDKDLKWHEVKADDWQLDFVQFCADHTMESDATMFYGVAYVIAPDEVKDVKLAIGSDDSSVWTVNGKEVIRVYASRGVNQDEDVSKPLTLKKGLNVVRFVVINGDGGSGAAARFLDAKDQPVKNLTVTLTPPAMEAATKP